MILDLDRIQIYNQFMRSLRWMGSGWLWILMLAAAGILASSGCSKSQVKDTETAQQIEKIDSFLSSLQQVYSKKDLPALKTYFSEVFQNQHPELFDTLRIAFDETDQLQLDLTVDLIQMDAEAIKVLLHWELNTWSGVQVLQNRGNTTLRLTHDQSPKVSGLEGDNPFIAAAEPIRQERFNP